MIPVHLQILVSPTHGRGEDREARQVPRKSSARQPSVRRTPGLVLLAFVPIALLAGAAAATTVAKTMIRVAPGDTWCPIGLTEGELRPDFQSSDPVNLNRGAFETSFRVPPDGWVYVTLRATTALHIDNILFLDRESFQTGSGAFTSDQCHRSGGATLPEVRVHGFDPTSMWPPWRGWQFFDLTALDELTSTGWEAINVDYAPGVSATESLPVDDQAAVVASCPGATTCGLSSGSLLMGSDGGPSMVRFPVSLPAGNDVTMQLWWKADPGERLDVRIDDFASCPEPLGTFFVEPASSEINVEVLAAELDGGIDPNFIWFEDGSDTFGFVTIDGDVYEVPQIDNEDRPVWSGAASFRKSDVTDYNKVPVKIELWDADDLGIRAHVDLNPDPTKRDLDLEVDLCKLRVEGDLSGDLGGRLVSTGDPGSGNDQGTVRFMITTPDDRPQSTDDLAVTDVDLVQAVHRSRFVVTERPTVVMVTLANNFTTTKSTEVLIEVYGPAGFFLSQRFPVTLEADSAETFYFFEDTPIIVPGPTPGVPSYMGLNVTVDPDGLETAGLDPDDCRLENDTVVEREWKIVDTADVHVTYCPILRPLSDPPIPTPPAQLADIRDLGTSYMRGVLPTASVSSATCPVPMMIHPLSGLLDPLKVLLLSVGVPEEIANVLDPFLLVWDLNTFASLTPGIDKILGILPHEDWYRDSFAGWDNVTGNSLGTAAKRAAILLPRVSTASGPAPKVTLPAHELSHTWGMSSDPRIKNFFCAFTFPGPIDFAALACGAGGALDEYTAADPARAAGNPATGYWLPLGGEDPRLVPFMGEQCDRHCYMGRASANQLGDWQANGRWIDLRDWEFLVEELARHPDPELLQVSGFIDREDNVVLGSWFRVPEGVPDRVDGDPGAYRLVFHDVEGNVLQDVGFPFQFSAPDAPVVPPATFFSFTAPWVDGTHRIDVVRLGDSDVPQATLAQRFVSPNPPTVEITTPDGTEVDETDGLTLNWQSNDADGDPLDAVVLASADGDTWYAMYGWIEGQQQVKLPAAVFPPGELHLKVAVMDGIHRTDSTSIAIIAKDTSLIFADNFEDGSTSLWSSTSP